MIITDAFWEKRNLGIGCLEIELSETDSIKDVNEAIKLYNDIHYVVIKTPVNCKQLLWELPKNGYNFVESQLALQVSKESYRCPSYLKIAERNTSIKRLSNEHEIKMALEYVSNDVFDSDRISLDIHFSKETAGLRYKNWVIDLIKKGQDFLELNVKDKPIGFFIAQNSKGRKGFAGLAGIYTKYKGKGFGTVLIKKGMDYIFEAGNDEIFTSVSSNNKEIIKIHLMLGFEISNISYVYIKHI